METEQLKKLFNDAFETYQINPQKPVMSRRSVSSELLHNLGNYITYLDEYEEALKESIAWAKYKNVDILKGKVSCVTKHYDSREKDFYTRREKLSPILACAYMFFYNEHTNKDGALKALKYLVANGDIEKHKKEIKVAFEYLFINRFYSSNNNYRTVGDELKKCSDNFKEIFNIFLALGADIDLMFYSLGDWEPNEQYEEFIKMLISLKDERVNKFLCERCLCGDYKFMFDLLKENNINNFEVNQAIKLISNNSYNPDDAVKCVLYLLEQGVFQAQDFNEENIKKNIDNITFDYHYKEKQFYKIFSDMIYEFEKNQTSPKKKIETKTQLLGKKKQLEKKTQAEKENDKILTNVQKNDEKVSKKSQEDKFMDSILAEAQKNVEMER